MPDPIESSRPRIAVLGAGITGLAAAVRLHDTLPDAELVVLEATDRAGGVLHTVRRNGFLVERSADNFLTKETWATDFCERLGVGDQLLPTDEARRKALVLHGGQITPAPEGFVLMAPRRLAPALKSPLLSWRGKLRLCCEPFVSKRTDSSDESVASFARRRLGNEVFERLVQPLLAGIYTADPEKLSMAATMPQFLQQEQQYGSLARAAMKMNRQNGATESRASGARYGLFLAPRGGMQELVDAAVVALPADSLRQGTEVTAVTRDDHGWRLWDAQRQPLGRFDAVVVTLPAHRAAPVLGSLDDQLSSELSSIDYAGCSVVCLGYRREQITAEMPGFGFVVPSVERRKLIAASFASLKFPGRAPGGCVLLRAFVGGALQPELADLPDDQLQQLAAAELDELLGVRGEPLMSEIARWPKGMPQYHVGHVERVERIEAITKPHAGLELAGAAYRGVGVPQCIHGAEQAADRIIDYLRNRG